LESSRQGQIPFEEEASETAQAGKEPSKLDEETLEAGEETLDVNALLAELPKGLRELVQEIHGERLPKEKLREVIYRLCDWKPSSTRQLALLLGKRREYLSTHITPMVEEGNLERTHPEAPRSPNQKYRVPSKEGNPEE